MSSNIYIYVKNNLKIINAQSYYVKYIINLGEKKKTQKILCNYNNDVTLFLNNYTNHK
jgi:predicted acyltransferase (DUF342 family)